MIGKVRGSGNILKDYEEWRDALADKYKIKDVIAFEKDFFIFLDKNIKEGYEDFTKLTSEVLNNEENMESITLDFFNLINKHAGDFDFREGVKQETKNILRERNKK